jgi:hypothetical protein
MGDAIIGDYSVAIPFRVWNNRKGMKRGIGTATGIRVVLKYEPLPHHNAMDSLKVIQGQCVLSGKLDTSVVEQFGEFPLESTNYDTLESGQFNQYEMRLDFKEWPEKRKFIIEDYLSKVYIVVELDD